MINKVSSRYLDLPDKTQDAHRVSGYSHVIVITGVTGLSYSQLCAPKGFLLSNK